ncbi:MAG: HemK2/MTQ2 family protein methyltransferase [Candidatus Micrarchaeia archaeon]
MENEDFQDIKIKSCPGVYYPAEDSWLLAKQVRKYAFGRVLDMGTGSGIQGIIAAKKGCEVDFADKSQAAMECASSNASMNHVHGRFILTDLFKNIHDKYNTIIFNPPYLPNEKVAKPDLSLDGGAGGRELISKFIKAYPAHILQQNIILLVESSFNNYEKDASLLNAKIEKEHYFFEDIAVLIFGTMLEHS